MKPAVRGKGWENMLDFKLIETGEDFESLCEELLIAEGFRIVSRPARELDDSFQVQRQRFLIECKHHAQSNESVKERHVGSITERALSHGCTNYLLITSTVPSESVKNMIERIHENPRTHFRAAFWNKHDLARR